MTVRGLPLLLNQKPDQKNKLSQQIAIIKEKGKIIRLEKSILKEKKKFNGCQVGIGHTRWATHGEPSQFNSHPHFSQDKTVAIVHNGIIENHKTIRTFFIQTSLSIYFSNRFRSHRSFNFLFI